jgi:hypothetical protein
MRRLKAPSPAMVVALIALFVALGGTGYAAGNAVFSPPSKAVIIRIVKSVAPKLNVKGAAGLTPLPSGRSESGVFAAATSDTGTSDMGTAITYARPLSAPIADSHIIDVQGSLETTASCSGPGHAAPGYLCLYDYDHENTGVTSFHSDDASYFPASVGKYGVTLYWTATSGSWPYVGGSWTVTAR